MTNPQSEPSATSSRHLREVQFVPSTINKEARTVEVVWTAGGSVRRYDVFNDRLYTEVLDVSEVAIDLSRLNSGRSPVLDTHSMESSEKVKGVVERAWIIDGKGYALLRFADTADVDAVWRKIETGILCNVSVGYEVLRYEVDETTSPVTYRATKWLPLEISMVPIGADAGAGTRSQTDTAPPIVLTQEETETMTIKVNQDPAPLDADAANPPVAPAAPPAPSAEATVTAVRAQMVKISSMVRQANLPAEFAEGMIERGLNEGQAAQAILTELSSRSAGQNVSPHVQVRANAAEDPEQVRAAMAEAISARATYRTPQTEFAREFMGESLLDMGAALMQKRGEKLHTRNRSQLYDLLTRNTHTTSDFPLLLADSANKMLRADYEQAKPTYQRIAARKRFKDFKAHSFLTVGDFPTLVAFNEAQGLQYGTMSESREQVAVSSYQRGIRLSRQIIINDDLNAFGDLYAKAGRRVADFENATAFGVIALNSGSGPVMADGNQLFSAAHTNKAGSGAAINVASIGAGRAAMMKQQSLDKLKLNLQGRLLLVGPDKDLEARQLTTAITPATSASVNPYAGLLEVLTDANVSGNAWYLLADPSQAEVFVYGYLEGNDGPQISMQTQFGTGGIEMSVMLDFAFGVSDFRGGYFNAGA